jgi:predicted Zn-dependent protease with MMP-like domain
MRRDLGISNAIFERMVENALAQVPVHFRRRMNNVVIMVEDEPAQPGLLGLYEGRPLGERSVSEGFALPDKISIYRGPHLRMARDRDHLRRIVAETLWHEIGHYFGMDERQVERAQRRRWQGPRGLR